MDVNYYMLGLGVGILTALFVLLILRLAGRGRCAQKYDERQRAAQGRAATTAFYTGMAYSAVCIALDGMFRAEWLTVSSAMFAGLILTVGVYAISCILHDAYFNLSDSPRKTLILLAVLAALQFFNAWRALTDDGLLLDGKLNMQVVMSLPTGVMMALVIITAAVRLALDKRRGERDEES